MYPNYLPLSLFRSHCHMRKMVNSTYYTRFRSFKWKNPTGRGSFVMVNQSCRTYRAEAGDCERNPNQLLAGKGQAVQQHLASGLPNAEPKLGADLLIQ